jgi:4-carboxymuconolactone decarboxylase
MSRIADLDPETLTTEQRRVYDDVARVHGRVSGLWLTELRNPDVAHHFHALYERLGRHPEIGKRLIELMILVVGRNFTAQYMWVQHERQALANGIAPAAVEAIRERRVPAFERDDERIVYELVRELLESNRISQLVFDQALSAFGEKHLVELISAVGLYTMIAMQLNAFDVRPKLEARLLNEP